MTDNNSFIIAVYMFDYNEKCFRKVYLHEPMKDKVAFSERYFAKIYKDRIQAEKDVELIKTLKSTFCKTLNIVIEKR